MDAAHKLIKTAGLLSVIALLMAAPGWAQILIAPPTVNLAGTAGQDVNVTSSTSPATEITYTIGAPTYSNDNGGAPQSWLKVSGGLTTPTSLSFNLFQTSGLLQGTHQATVILTPTAPAGVAAVTITVTYTSGTPGGGGSGTLAANPNPIALTAATGNSSFPATVTITTTSTAPITLTLGTNTTSGGSTWLTATFNATQVISASSTTNIQVTANAAGLTPAIYQGTVTLTPSAGGIPLVIPVTFTVTGTSSGNGTWTATPNSVPFTLTTNSGNLPSASVTVTTSSPATTYNAATSSGGWLLVNGSTTANGLGVGVPITLSVSNVANGLPTGSYPGTVTIIDLNGVAQATVSVSLTVNGGTSSGLNISPNPASFNSQVNGGQQNASVAVSSSTGGALSINGALPGWLSFSLPSNTTLTPGVATAFQINVNPTGLSAATYSTNLGITVGPQSGILVVNLVVGGGGGTGTGATAVTPTSLTFAYQFGSNPANVAQQKIIITGQAGNWSSVISNGGTWLNISPSGGGALPDPASPPTVFVTPAGLAVGPYTGTIAITTPGGTVNLSVTLNVTTAPIILATPGSLSFVSQTGAGNPQPQSVFFSGTDPTVGALAITATSNNPWITVSASASSMTVFVDPTGLGSGVYSGSITVVQPNVANSPYNYPVLLVVNGGVAGPLTFTPGSLTFNSNNGVTTPASSTLTVGANAATNFTYATSVNGPFANWIAITPVSNGSGTTTTNLTVSVNPAGLTPNTYTGAITFNANGTTQTLPITLIVGSSGGPGGNVTVTPTSLTFLGQAGASALATQAITVSSASGTAPVTFTVTPTTTTGGSWLSTNANPSNATPSTITVTANPSSLAAGTYTGNLAIQPAGGTLLNVPITLNLTAVATVSALPTSLTFDYRAGDTPPAAQTVAVAGTGLTFSATAVSAGNWLVVSPASGTAPGAVSVSINPAGLVAGTYNGTVTIAGTGAATGTTAVTVSLTVTVPLPTLTKVTNAGSFATGTIAPGEIVTLFAADPTHPIGPTTPVFLTLDTTGKVSTTIGGVQVLINGLPCPLTFANATQVSAVVPYEVAQSTGNTATVQVKLLGQTSNGLSVNVATTAPGLFTQNSSGTGPGAILNSNNSLNAPNNAATRGDTVVVYLTGEGQTSPAGVTGKVTTVSSTLPLTPGPLLPVSILVGGQPANYSFAGEAPTFVSGAMQLNVIIPTNIGTGEQEILVTIGGNQSQKGVTVSVK